LSSAFFILCDLCVQKFRMTKNIILIVVGLSFAAEASAQQKPLDFAHQIAPILKKHCVECHGGDNAKGGFSLNTRELFLEDEMAAPGKPGESHFLELVGSNDPEAQMPPKGKPRVSAEQTARLKAWISAGMKWDAGFTFATKTYEPPLRPRRPELPPVVEGRANPVDRIVDAYFVENSQTRPAAISDAAFLRRVHLDLVGLLPTPKELSDFLADRAPNKRAKMIGALLADDLRYTEHWLTFWNDLLRNDYGGTGFITGGRKQVSGWLYQSLIDNKPYDQMARELIAPPTPESRGYIDGIKWRGKVSAGQTIEIQFAQSVAQSFLGINMKCASCHDSFIDRWKLSEAYGLAAIYSSRPLDIHRCDKPTGETAKAAWLFPELGHVDAAAPPAERLSQLAGLMTHPENGRFTRTIVNRLWAQLMGRGIVHPLDAMQTAPWNADLLDYLATHLQDNAYDLKSVLALIANSQTYQSEVESLSQAADVSGDVFAGPRAKRMTAEQFVDSLWQLTDSAPTSFDAPVSRGKVDPTEVASTKVSAEWIWGDSANGGVPAAGEQLAFYTTFKIDKPIQSAGAIVTCDNEFALNVNSREMAKGNVWTQLGAATITTALKQGENTIVILGKNAGDTPNLAGLYFEARINFADGESLTIKSDKSWQFASKFPAKSPVRRWKLKDLKWQPVTIVPAIDVWKNAIDPVASEQLVRASRGSALMVRAALLKSDFLMRSLGRPNRDQIVSSRPNDLTTLEAIDLSNNESVAKALARGGQRLAEQEWPDKDHLINHLFSSTLTRLPADSERPAVQNAISDEATSEQIEDLLWALCMTPEFLLIR
jgi:mono/diheme cytochrome c family protein